MGRHACSTPAGSVATSRSAHPIGCARCALHRPAHFALPPAAIRFTAHRQLPTRIALGSEIEVGTHVTHRCMSPWHVCRCAGVPAPGRHPAIDGHRAGHVREIGQRIVRDGPPMGPATRQTRVAPRAWRRSPGRPRSPRGRGENATRLLRRAATTRSTSLRGISISGSRNSPDRVASRRRRGAGRHR